MGKKKKVSEREELFSAIYTVLMHNVSKLVVESLDSQAVESGIIDLMGRKRLEPVDIELVAADLFMDMIEKQAETLASIDEDLESMIEE